jgi:hypothetical protein
VLKSALKRLPHPVFFRLHLRGSLRRQAALARAVAARTGYPLAQELFLPAVKTSDTCFVLGGGSTINQISESGWQAISRCNSIGINLWPIHPFVPTILMFENLLWEFRQPVIATFQRLMNARAGDYRHTVKLVSEMFPLERRQLILEIPESFRPNLYVGYSGSVVARTEAELARGLRYLRRRGFFDPGRNLPWQFKYGSSVIAAMSLAARMNYRRIVLCGIDLGKAQYFYQDRERFPEACQWEFMPRSQPQVTAVRLEWRLPAAEAIHCFKREVLDPAGLELFVENRMSALFPEIPELRAETLDAGGTQAK